MADASREEERDAVGAGRLRPAHTLDSHNRLSVHPYPFPSIAPALSVPGLPPPARLRVVAFGASTVQQAAFPDGFWSLLSARYQRRADLFNRGYSGYTSRMALALLREHLSARLWPYDPQRADGADSGFRQLVLLSLGSNDSCRRFSRPPFLHTPLPAFERAMRAIIGLLVPELAAVTAPLSHYPSRTSALVLLTPLDDPHWLAYRRFRYAPRDPPPPLKEFPPPLSDSLTPYADTVRALAAEYHVPVCDLGALMSPDDVLEPGSSWTRDGCHLNAEGSARLFKELVRVIETAYPSLAVHALPMDGPEKDSWDYSSDPVLPQPWLSPSPATSSRYPLSALTPL